MGSSIMIGSAIGAGVAFAAIAMYVLYRLDTKVDKNYFELYCKNVDKHLEEDTKRFDKIDDSIRAMSKELTTVSTCVQSLLKVVKLRQEYGEREEL